MAGKSKLGLKIFRPGGTIMGLLAAVSAEWNPWLARKLDLGSLPLYQGVAVVAVALLPSAAVLAVGALSFEYDDVSHIHDGFRRLSSSDSSKCTINTIVAYVLAGVVFAMALVAFFRVLGSNRALVDMIKLNAEMEKRKFLSLGSGLPEIAWKATASPTTAKALSESQVENFVEDSADSGEGTATAFLESQFKKSKFFCIFNLIRFILAEVAILVGLLGPFVLECGTVNIWTGIQMGVGIIGSAISLGIPLWCVIQMSRDKYGMYKFFPGSQSNKLYELCTGVKVRAVLPDRGEVSGKMRMNWITKYQLCACGASMGLGLIIKLVAAILLLVNIGGTKDNAPIAFAMFFVCLFNKLPECFMYTGLWYTFCADFFCFLVGLWNPCCRREYDEDDYKELFSCYGRLSCFSTRSDPPVGKCNWCSRFIEKKFFDFYQWFYVFIDKPLSGFKWCTIFPCYFFNIAIIYNLNWSAVAKEYEEAEAFEMKLHAATGNPELELRASKANRLSIQEGARQTPDPLLAPNPVSAEMNRV